MSSPNLPDVSITELQNALGIIPATANDICVVVGCSSKGPLNTPAAYATVAGLVADFGEGPGVDDAALILNGSESANGGTPIIFMRVPSSTPGSLGVIDVSLVTGTAVASGTGVPLNAYEGYFEVVTGGTIGTAGITFIWSLDNKRTFSAITSLGVADTFTFPGSGFGLLFSPSSTDQTALNTLINQIFTKLNAHVVLTTGTVHSNADSTDVVSSGTYPSATNTATRVARINALRAAYELHRVKDSALGTPIHINVGGDTTNAITAPVATDDESALVLALNLKAKLNAHEAGTTWHTIADATNTVTASAPSPGTLLAGDIIRLEAFEPKWVASDLTAAAAVLQAGQQAFGFLQISGSVDATEAGTIGTALDGLRTAKKYKWAIWGARGQDAGESESVWMSSIESDYAATARPDIAVCGGTWWQNSPIAGRKYKRRISGAVAARLVTLPIYVDAAKVRVGQLKSGTLFDTTQNPIGYDENAHGGLGLAASKFIVLRTFTNNGLGAYINNPYLMSSVGSDFVYVQHRRIMNVLEATIYVVGVNVDLNAEGAVDPALVPGQANTAYINELTARDIEFEMRAEIATALGKAISNPDDPRLFVLSRTDPVLTNGGILTANARIEPLLYIKGLNVTTGFTA
jgi:Protein of unknown function (DUF2586)